MNNMLINVCNIALGAITQQEWEAQAKFRRELEKDHPTGVGTTVAGRQYEHEMTLLKQNAEEVRRVRDILYKTPVVETNKCQEIVELKGVLNHAE